MMILEPLLASYAGAVFYRMRGGAPSWPRPIEQMLFCSIYAIFMLAVGCDLPTAIIAYTLAVIACCTGHGQYFLDMKAKYVKPETLDFLLRPLFGRDPRNTWSGYEHNIIGLLYTIEIYGRRKLYWRCVAGMALTGFAITLAPGIAVGFVNPLQGALLALSGLIKAPAYMVAEKIGLHTEGGEYYFGAYAWFFAFALCVGFGGSQ